MKKYLRVMVTSLCLLPLLVHAQATRTWVSGVGDDANPCSRTAPCKTFPGAISKTAVNGVIDVLDPGGFGAVTITKSITIEAPIAEGSILVAGTHGIIINAPSNAVVILRNLTIEGVGIGLSGIQILSAGAVYVENCRINGFANSGINFIDSVPNAQLFVKNTTIHTCALDGIHLAPTAPATVLIEGVKINGCDNGINAGTNTSSVVVDTTASGNAGAGFLVSSNAQMTITRGIATDNNIGVESSGDVTLANSTVANNFADGLKMNKPGKIRSARNNLLSGNSPEGKANASVSAK